MSLFHGLILRRLMITIFLFIGLLSQGREIFACDLMGGKAQLFCCCSQPMERADGCDRGGGCSLPSDPLAEACCEVEVVKLSSFTSPSSFQLLVALLDGLQPPPDVLPTTIIDIAFIKPFLSRNDAPFFLSAWLPRTRTYLLTRRFRI